MSFNFNQHVAVKAMLIALGESMRLDYDTSYYPLVTVVVGTDFQGEPTFAFLVQAFVKCSDKLDIKFHIGSWQGTHWCNEIQLSEDIAHYKITQNIDLDGFAQVISATDGFMQMFTQVGKVEVLYLTIKPNDVVIHNVIQ